MPQTYDSFPASSLGKLLSLFLEVLSEMGRQQEEYKDFPLAFVNGVDQALLKARRSPPPHLTEVEFDQLSAIVQALREYESRQRRSLNSK